MIHLNYNRFYKIFYNSIDTYVYCISVIRGVYDLLILNESGEWIRDSKINISFLKCNTFEIKNILKLFPLPNQYLKLIDFKYSFEIFYDNNI